MTAPAPKTASARTPKPTHNEFDLAALRAQFPLLETRVRGEPLVYLDSAASAQKPRAVLDAMAHAHEHAYANVHRSVHYLGNLATEAYEDARAKTQTFLNAKQKEEIIFTTNGTAAFNLVASSFAQPRIQPGDEIVLTRMEHHSNIVPWHFLRERNGAVLRWVGLCEDGSLDEDDFAAALSERTKLVALTHVSNVLGTVTPVQKLVRLAHGRGIPVLVDGCQGAVHCDVDVQALGCDFYVCTAHKLYGPTGIGILYGKAEHLREMRPFLGGGEMIAEVREETIRYAPPPQRFEAGTPPFVQAVGLAAALDFLGAQDRAALGAHEAALLAAASARLDAIAGLTQIGRAPNKASILSFAHDDVHPHDLATLLDRYGIAVRAGHHCAEPLLRSLGLSACARASFAIYNTLEEMDALGDGLERALAFFERGKN